MAPVATSPRRAAHETKSGITENPKHLIEETRSLIASLEADVLSVKKLKAKFHARGTSQRRRSSLLPDKDDPLQVDWELYRAWPEGCVEEEKAMLDYFRKLKFIYLEQETKMRFLVEISDDQETGTEAIVYTAKDVANKEKEAKVVKSELAAAKARVRALRAEIDALADSFAAPFTALEADAAESARLLAEMEDMELELARIKALRGGTSGMTIEEAEAVLEEQVDEMQRLEDGARRSTKSVERSKKELASALRALDRLNAERSSAEAFANEAARGNGKNGRDLELERVCAVHTSTLTLLKSLLGVASISTPNDREVRISYAPERVTLCVRFEKPGGRIVDSEILSQDSRPINLSEESQSRIEAAQDANDIALLVQEALYAVRKSAA